MMEPMAPGIGEPLLSTIPWFDQLLIIGVSSARFGFAFIWVPVFSREVMPATVRNSIIVTFGMVALAMTPDFAPRDLTAAAWALMLIKEAAAGTIIGLFFATVLWAMAAAGEIIDTKVGATVAQLVDPLTGTTTSLNGILFGRFAQVLFVSMGGLTILVGAIMNSYMIWPLGPGGLTLNPASIAFFEGEFGRFFTWAFVFSVPVVTMLYLVDLGMGFLNRFSPQFNVFALSLPIKSIAATLVILLVLPAMAQAIITDLGSREAVSGSMLQRTATPEKAAQP
ncbi:MAG: type III secretion system export apparatus subunit SctT [Sphingorhabdus sp.]